MRNQKSSMNKIMKIALASSLFLASHAYAGTWGTGSFDNDSAADWVYELEQSKTTRYLLTVFNAVPSEGYIEVDGCSAAIAAADVAASLKDGKTEHLPKVVAAWVQDNNLGYKPILATMAIQALSFCKSTKRSELAQLWQEATPKQWLSQVSEIEARLQ
jgi:Domain of unknown function (DUF4259)